MRKLGLLFFAFSSISAFACNPEAMFIGTVTKLTVYPDHYTYQVRLGHEGKFYFQPSGVCALWEPEVEAAVIVETGTPAIANGDMVSGVMVQDEATGKFHVE